MPINLERLPSSTSDRRGRVEIERAPDDGRSALRLALRGLFVVMPRALLLLLWSYRWELAPLVAATPAVLFVSDLFAGRASVGQAFPAVLGAVVAYCLASAWWTRSAWELHNADRALMRFRRRWPDHALALGLTRQDKRGEPVAPKVKNAQNLGGGSFRWELALPRGITSADIERESESLAGAYSASSVMVERDPRDASRVTLTVIGQDDPLYGAPLDPLPLTSMAADRDPDASVPVGYTSTGEPATVTLRNASLLIGGSPGSGKSVALSGLLTALSLSRDTSLWLVDPKRVEFGPWRDCADRVALDHDEATALVDDLVAEMNRRYEHMEASGLRFLPPSSEWPRLVLVVDELAELTASGVSKESKTAAAHFAEQLRRLVAKGRACSIVPVLATQKPDSSVVPTSIRDLMAVRIAYRCGTEAQAITILGDEAVKTLGATPHTLGSDTPGVGYMVGEKGDRAVRLRSYFLADGQVAAIASRAAAWRHGLVPVGTPRPDASFELAPARPAPPSCPDHVAGGGSDCLACRAAWERSMLDLWNRRKTA